MAPNKFEKHIKKQLKEREINPSKDAWSKLSAQLEDSGESEKKNYFWYAIAASFIGLLMVSVLYVNSLSTEANASIQVVKNPEMQSNKNELKKELKDNVEPTELVEITTGEKPKVKEKQTQFIDIPDSKRTVASFEKVKKPIDEVVLNEDSKEIIHSKVLEVIAQADALEEINNDLTEAEVDSLLRKAQKEILTEKLFKSDRSVDAMALLTEVEGELDKSFRDQIFESLKTGFLKVRTAVADRNN